MAPAANEHDENLRTAESRLARQLAFQTLVARIATDFLNLRGTEMDQGIQRALGEIASFGGGKFATIAMFGGEAATEWRLEHVWLAEGFLPPSPPEGSVETAPFYWVHERLARGEVVQLLDPDGLPQDAEYERSFFTTAGVHSILMLPILSEGSFIGGISFASTEADRRWDPEIVELMQLVAKMFLNAMERKKADEALRESHARLDAVRDSGVVGIAVGGYDGRIYEANEPIQRSLGIDLDDIAAGRARWDTTTAPEFRAADARAIAEVRVHGHCRPYEKEVLGRDGERYPVLMTLVASPGHPDRFLTIANGIGQQKQLEAELRHRNSFDRTITELSQTLINVAPDRLDETITHTLEEIAELTGSERASVYRLDEGGVFADRAYGWMAPSAEAETDSITRIPLDAFPWWWQRIQDSTVLYVPEVARLPDEAQAERALLLSRDIQTFVSVTMRLGGKPLGFLLFLTVGEPRAWPEGDRAMLPVFAETIASALDRAAAEKRVQRLHADLERRVHERTRQFEAANKELEAFSYSVSHDLRAPLRGIDGFTKILVDECADALDDDAKDLLHRTRQASGRLGELIDALLSLSRISREQIHWNPVDLSELAREASARLRDDHPERNVEVTVTEGLVAHGEERLLAIAIDNLIGNAWKFTSKKAQAHIEFGVQTDGDRPVYFVRDDGAGFDSSFAGNLFGAFQRLHGVDEFEGHGIGLATVQRILSRHGGRVWAEGAVDVGATFYFVLGDPPDDAGGVPSG